MPNAPRLIGTCLDCDAVININLRHLREGYNPKCSRCDGLVMPVLVAGLKVTKDHTKEAVYGT